MKTSPTKQEPEAISVTDLPDQMKRVFDAVEFRGLEFDIVRHGVVVASIVPKALDGRQR